MALIRANSSPRLIEREPSLVVFGHDLFELISADWKANIGSTSQQVFNHHPTTGLERESQDLRLMPQVLAQERSDGDEVLGHLQRLMWPNGMALLAPQREEIDK